MLLAMFDYDHEQGFAGAKSPDVSPTKIPKEPKIQNPKKFS